MKTREEEILERAKQLAADAEKRHRAELRRKAMGELEDARRHLVEARRLVDKVSETDVRHGVGAIINLIDDNRSVLAASESRGKA
jgi:hypothetical protein